MSTLYSSGLRGGFADLWQLPRVTQVDLSGQRSFEVPYIGKVTDRITLLNILNRTNLIRPPEGIRSLPPLMVRELPSMIL